jgi:hypothetical protein
MSAWSGARRLARGAAAFLCAWWRADRVRVSPREGRLLRLEPPCFLIIEGRLAEVLGRERETGAGGRTIVYACLTDSGPGELRVSLPDPGRRLEVKWVNAAGEKTLSEEEITVYPGAATGW